MIGIIVAMDKEQSLLLPLLNNVRDFFKDGYTFYLGNIGEKQVSLMKCGIGKVNAALATRAMIENFAPEVILNSGVAGGVGSHAKIMDVVVADAIAYCDVWCGPGTTFGQAADCPLYFETLRLQYDFESNNIKKGLICSSDKFISSIEDVRFIKSHFPEVIAVDMESGAIAQTCYLNNTPFMVIRVVSDTPGEDDNISQYENFWEKAPEATFNIIREILLQCF